MVKQVIKRDGTVQEFNVGKMNQWGMHAAQHHGINTGEWQAAVQSALIGMPESVTTEQLQRALIRQLLSFNTWNAICMAGTLEASMIQKRVFPSGIPSVRDRFENLHVMRNMMIKFPFTDKEWSEIDAMIDHDLDQNLPQFSLDYIASSYSLTDVKTKELLETPQFTYMRMACAVGSSYPEGERVAVISELYYLFSHQVLSAPTPNWTNLGTPNNGLASCCLYTADDDRRSLAAANHISYVMTYMSAGLGYHHSVRSVGDPVRNGSIEHQGEISYLKSIASAAAANRQKKRGGAVTAYVSGYSKEAEEIVHGRNPLAPIDSAIRGIDINLTINDDLLTRAIKSKPALHFTKWSHPDLYSLMHKPNYHKEFEHAMEEAIRMAPAEQTFNPRRVMGALGQVADMSGRLYAFFVDNANKHTSFKEPVYSSNLCVAPETQFLTIGGYKNIREMAGIPTKVWNGKEFTTTEVRKTGENQKLLTVVTDSGPELDCTEYHKWYVCNEYGKPEVEVRTIDLKPGDKLVKFDLPVIQGHKYLSQAYINGFYTGDGCVTPQGQRIYLYGDKQSLADEFEQGGVTGWTVQQNLNRRYKHFDTLFEKYFVPGCEYTVKSRLEWLAGYFDADGCVYRNGENQQLTATSVEKDFLIELQLMLQTLGIHSKIRSSRAEGVYQLPKNDGTGEHGDFQCKETYRLLITSNDTEKLRVMGLPLKRLVLTEQAPQRDATRFVQIKEVIDAGRYDDTYCFTEHKRGRGMFNGILTGQCVEVMQPTKPYADTADLYRTDDEVTGEVSLCNLAAVNHAKVADDPELHRRAVKAALRMIDYCIDYSHYELPHVGYTAKRRRNAGVGVMNTAAYMAKNGIRYNSAEGIEHMFHFAERQSYFLIEASLELGREKGNAEWMHKTKWTGYTNADGEEVKAWMPLDTGNNTIVKKYGLTPKMDWEYLRHQVYLNKGIRNSSLFALMPGESSSKALGTTNCIYPVRNLGLDKTDSTSRIQWVAEGAGNDDYNYQLAFELTELEQIEMYAAWQYWIDQGISADFFKDFSKTGGILKTNDILRKYKLMSNYGLKSHYYLVFKTQRSQAELEAADAALRDELSEGANDAVKEALARASGAVTAQAAEDFNAAACDLSGGGCGS